MSGGPSLRDDDGEAVRGRGDFSLPAGGLAKTPKFILALFDVSGKPINELSVLQQEGPAFAGMTNHFIQRGGRCGLLRAAHIFPQSPKPHFSFGGSRDLHRHSVL